MDEPIMLRALYDFCSEHKNILSFKAGDKFIGYETGSPIHNNPRPGSSTTQGWIYVIDGDLKNGYVPKTYVKADKKNVIGETQVYINHLMAKAKIVARESNCDVEKAKCKKIFKHLQSQWKLIEPSGEVVNGETPNNNSSCENNSEVITNRGNMSSGEPAAPLPDENKSSRAAGDEVAGMVGCELIEHVKKESGLGHKQARAAVESTLDFLRVKVPGMKAMATSILNSIQGNTPSGEVLENIHDWQRLKCIFSTIRDITGDVEQLNWALHEDQHIIIEFLEELIQLLTDGDPVVNRQFLQKEHYRDLEALVQYFQMETKPSIRQLLLKVFVALSLLDRICITVLVNSDLPQFLARDILDSKMDHQKLVQSCLVLTMLLWPGCAMPMNHYDVLNANFAGYLLDLMDEVACEDDADTVTQGCMELLLAFNLLFKEPTSNPIMEGLKTRSTVKEFLEKIIVLANREDDPVGALLDHSDPPPNSVHKMLLDIFDQSETSMLFYTNDLKVLIEIVARKLLDLPPDDKTQFAYLNLAYKIICNTDYTEHSHCSDEFQQCFVKIMMQDDTSHVIPPESRALVQQLYNKYPNIFRA